MNFETLSQENIKDLVHQLAWNDAFGCYTRAGFEKVIWPQIAARTRFLIFVDLDGVHALNRVHHGYEYVDGIVREVFSAVRSSDYVIGQLKSGDEFLIALTENDDHAALDPEGMVARLTQELGQRGMTATFVIVPVCSPDLYTNIRPAVDHIFALKDGCPAWTR